MSREVKFRVWSIEAYRFLQKDKYYIEPNGSIIWNYGSSFIMNEEENIIQQFTGLKDKNGQEIYEGDIVKVDKSILHDSSFIGLVNYKQACFFINEKNRLYCNKGLQLYHYDCLTSNPIEIIGNIFENLKLLNG